MHKRTVYKPNLAYSCSKEAPNYPIVLDPPLQRNIDVGQGQGQSQDSSSWFTLV